MEDVQNQQLPPQNEADNLLGQDKTLSQFILPYNSYFYRVVDKNAVGVGINNLFAELRKDSKKCFPQKRKTPIRKKIEKLDCKYSFLAFLKNPRKASFLHGDKSLDWEEVHAGYILIVEHGDYIGIVKRNAGSLETLTKGVLRRVSSKELLESQIETGKKIRKVALNSIEASDNSIQFKSFIADDLNNSFPRLGANKYAIRSIATSGAKKSQFSLNTFVSHISDGEYSCPDEERGYMSILKVCSWITTKIDSFIKKENPSNFIDLFARFEDYEDIQDKLKPVKLYIPTYSLVDWLEDNKEEVKKAEKQLTQEEREELADKYCKIFDIEADGDNFFVKINDQEKIDVEKNITGIRLKCRELSSVKTDEESLMAYINATGFSVYFEEENPQKDGTWKPSRYVYVNNDLVTPAWMHSDINGFLRYFEGDISNITSEKGLRTVKTKGKNPEEIEEAQNKANKYNHSLTEIPQGSIFRAVEDKYSQEYDYFILEDLSTELADHIGISKDKITFFEEKYKSSKMSASDLQEVVGQAIKNLGNADGSPIVMEKRKRKWADLWMKENLNIHRLRKYKENALENASDAVFEQGAKDAVDQWKTLVDNGSYRKEMAIVVNFISKKNLEDGIKEIKKVFDGEKAKTDNFEVVCQIISILNTFISSCQEMGFMPRIICEK